MIVLDDNNSYVKPTHLMVTLAVVTVWCSQIDDRRWCSWSLGDMLMTLMVPWWYGWWWWWIVEPLYWWWSPWRWWSLVGDAFMMEVWRVAWWVSAMMEMTYIDDDMIHSCEEMTYIDVMLWWAYLSLDEFRPCLACWWGSPTFSLPTHLAPYTPLKPSLYTNATLNPFIKPCFSLTLPLYLA